MHSSELLDLLPHQGPALWLEQLLEHDRRSMRGIANWSCLERLGPDASPTLLFEAAAQLCAAHGALYGQHAEPVSSRQQAEPASSNAIDRSPAAGPPSLTHTPAAAPPVLVGKVNAVQLHETPVARCGELAVRVTQQAASVAGAQYTFAIHHQERLLLDGTLLLVRADA